MIASQSPSSQLPIFEYNPEGLESSHRTLRSRRKQRITEHVPPCQMSSFENLVNLHRYVCFFVVQGSGSCYSKQSLSLRKRLATHYHDSMTTFVVSINSDVGEEADTLFCRGTGFASLPSSAILRAILNITQVPTIVVVDTSTGRSISPDAGLAMEWNEPHFVINAWQRGKSGLSCSQKALAVMTFQSSIM
jgi:hypothetical protein